MLVVNTGGSHSKALAPCRHVLIWLQDVPLFHSRPQQGSIGIRNPVQRAKHFPAKLLAGSINWALVAVWWHQMLRNLPSTSPRIRRQVLKECADRTKDELANSSMFWSGHEGCRDGICHSRHSRQECKIFASGVNFSRNNAVCYINESKKLHFTLISSQKLLTYY